MDDKAGRQTTDTRQTGRQQPMAISASLDALTCELIGLCLDALAKNEQLWPMLAYATTAEESCCFSFDDDTPEECIDAARAYIRSLNNEAVAYALAYDGFVQIDESGATQDALLVEFGERGAVTAYSAYVLYHKGKSEKDFFAGEPLPAGEEELLLS